MKKRVLLLATAVTVVAGCFAQAFDRTEKIKAPNNIVNNVRLQAVRNDATPAVLQPKRSADNNFYYSKPAGALYRCWDHEGSGYAPSFMILPPLTDFTFIAHSNTAATDTWTHTNSSGTTDWTSYKDANNNMTISALPNTGYYYGSITMATADGSNSFMWGSNNYYYQQNTTYYPRMIVDSIGTVSFIDDHTSGYGWGSLSTRYLYGTGTITDSSYKYVNNAGDTITMESGNTGTCVGIVQSLPKPAHAMYVEDVFITVKSENSTVLPEGKALTLTIANAETGDVIKTLTATANDTLFWNGPYTSSYTSTGEYYSGYILFADKTTDILGNTTYEPFVIDCPTVLTLTGIDQDGVSVGFNGMTIKDEDLSDFTSLNNYGGVGFFAVTYTNPSDAKDATSTYYYRYSNTVLNPCFTAVMDTVVVANTLYSYDDNYNVTATYENANAITFPTAGGAGTCESTGLGYIYVQTALDWTDEDGNEYYAIDNLPEWVTDYQVTKDENSTGNVYYISFTADALPSGTTGRYAESYLTGRGTTSVAPVIFKQGDVSGISSAKADEDVKTSGYIYNLNGQRMNKTAKGILIQNGKKFINK